MKIIIWIVSVLTFGVLADSQPTPTQVQHWLASEEDKVEVVKMEPVVLMGGEKAFVASLVFDDSSRNNWAGYALVRPKYKQARKISTENLGGQDNHIRLIYEGYDGAPSIVELGSAGSGQGYMSQYSMWVSFDGWSVIERYGEETYSDNAGTCGKELGMCETTQVFLNVIEISPLTIAKTTVVSKGKTQEDRQSVIRAEIVTPRKN